MNSPHRIGRRSDFQRTLSQGVRTRTRDLDVHTLTPATAWPDRSRTDVALSGGPWLGMIVSKQVGNSVVRHRLARRLRAAFRAAVLPGGAEAYVVVRARPSAARRSADELAAQLSKAVAP
ncbi:MAG: ribonuclease P protein component [Gordonia sp. (in: high G+C Gram-positive bacteria)]|uniref:ribonuclease P protein component n=1 Tax=Gordonia sp. (in: high G+C Gram-positive bacteria) TaxID=84139 RepID=UPI0039E2C2C7